MNGCTVIDSDTARMAAGLYVFAPPIVAADAPLVGCRLIALLRC